MKNSRHSLYRAFSTLGFPEGNLSEQFALAHRHSISAIEFRSLENTIDLPAYFESKNLSPDELRKAVVESGIKVTIVGTSLSLITATESDRAAFLRILPWAEALDGVALRVFDGGKTGDAREVAAATDTVKWWHDLKATKGWRTDIIMEPHDALRSGADILRFVESVPRLHVLWDTHHTWRSSGEAPAKTWDLIKNHVRHIHVKDSISAPSAQDPFTLVLPGMGEFPMRQLLEAVQGSYTGPISLEWERLWRPYLPTLEEALNAAVKNQWW